MQIEGFEPWPPTPAQCGMGAVEQRRHRRDDRGPRPTAFNVLSEARSVLFKIMLQVTRQQPKLRVQEIFEVTSITLTLTIVLIAKVLGLIILTLALKMKNFQAAVDRTSLCSGSLTVNIRPLNSHIESLQTSSAHVTLRNGVLASFIIFYSRHLACAQAAVAEGITLLRAKSEINFRLSLEEYVEHAPDIITSWIDRRVLIKPFLHTLESRLSHRLRSQHRSVTELDRRRRWSHDTSFAPSVVKLSVVNHVYYWSPPPMDTRNSREPPVRRRSFRDNEVMKGKWDTGTLTHRTKSTAKTITSRLYSVRAVSHRSSRSIFVLQPSRPQRDSATYHAVDFIATSLKNCQKSVNLANKKADPQISAAAATATARRSPTPTPRRAAWRTRNAQEYALGKLRGKHSHKNAFGA
ncbi:hypothetical protein EVAR_79178_1 [Eumeta japonica]|uniref:Uncharacterized protein n=1 Tax=Eumeta variegata TaxID=151549 RepID=A0A4C1UTJ9_EUMVA|nr:hypothetical protein EVAR_79178_1 [Eumeta japonica]